MNVAAVEAAVEAIRRDAGDDESQHSDEDKLHRKVLRAIASGETDDAAGLAAAALKTRAINFVRWYA